MTTHEMVPMERRQVQAQVWTQEQLDLIKRTICPAGLTNDEFGLFVQTAQRLGLDPFARQIYAVKRWNAQAGREVMQTQVSIDGFRVVAERHGDYAGQLGPFWCGEDGLWCDSWLSANPPVAAKVGILRHTFKEPCWGVARFDAYKQTKKDGGLTGMWARMPDVMIAKCAEALGLRRAFPQDLSGVYAPEEMAQADNPTPDAIDVTPEPKPAKRKPKAADDPHEQLLEEVKAALLKLDADKAARQRRCAEVFNVLNWSDVQKLADAELVAGLDKLAALIAERDATPDEVPEMQA